MKTGCERRHLSVLCFSSIQLEVWISESKARTRLLTILWLISVSLSWWISFDSVENIERLYPVEQIVPQPSAGGSGLEWRKVLLISCLSNSIVLYK